MVNPEMNAVKLPEKEATAFGEVVAKLNDGIEYVPVLYAGWQIVSGLNYRFICKAKPRGDKEWSSVVLMQVYAPLSGLAELSGIEEIL